MALLIDGINEAANPVMTFVPLILMLLSGYGLGKIISIVRELRNNGNSDSDRSKGNNNKSSNVIAIIKSNVISDISNSSFSVKDLMSGSIVLNFLFISGFILFGLIIYAAKEYFSAFTIILVILSTVGIYYLVVIPLVVVIKRRKKSLTVVDSSKDSSSPSSSSDNTTTASAPPPSSRANAVSTNRTYNDAEKFLLSPSSFNTASDITNHKNSNLLLILFGIALFSALVVYHGIIIYYHPIFSEYDSIYLILTISKSILLGNGLNHDYYLGSDVFVRYPPFVPAIDAWLIYSFGYSSLRIFPVYFVLLGSIAVYLFARNITKDSFLGLIASAAFLITPALLVLSSRFSLQLDISFVFALSATFYFLSEIIGNNNNSKKPAKIYFIMLIVCLSLLPLIREMGLVISLAILFFVLAIKFTHGNIMLKALFSLLSFLPFYVFGFFDLFQYGFITTNTIRLITLLIANIAVFYILTKVNKNQDRFISLIKLRTIKYLIPFVIPLIFISSNMIMFNGPYPAFVFFYTNEYIESVAPYDAIITSTNTQGDLSLSEELQERLLRLDLLFSLTAMGSVFIFFKLHGFGRLGYFGLKNTLKNNYQYLLILILLIFLLAIWSFFLDSGFGDTRGSSDIRHTTYFLPILAVILVVGMNATKKLPLTTTTSSTSSLLSQKQLFHKLFYYGIIVLATYYFLSFSLYTWIYNNHFGGFWIEPHKSPFVTLHDLGIAAFLFAALIIFELKEQKISLRLKKYNFQRYLAFGFMALLAVQIYVLSLSLSSSGRILMAPIETIDQVPPRGWEQNVFEVVNCLNTPESGNVLSFRAPAIPFFTNRTNYDLFFFGTFHSLILPLLEQAKNSTLLKQELLDNGINYVVLPNEKNSFFYLVDNVMKQYNFIQLINNASEFEKRSLEKFDLYKSTPTLPSSVLNLIDENNIWKPVNLAGVMHDERNLLIYVNIDNNVHTGKQYNRAVLQTQINTALYPPVLDLEYTSQSLSGNATFYAEILDNDGKIMWARHLTNTGGKLADETFSLPSNIIDEPIEFRLYVITDAPGEHFLTVTKADITSC
jgi:Dolichyl-phosphate-mannose-protein mannosyltransferase